MHFSSSHAYYIHHHISHSAIWSPNNKEGRMPMNYEVPHYSTSYIILWLPSFRVQIFCSALRFRNTIHRLWQSYKTMYKNIVANINAVYFHRKTWTGRLVWLGKGLGDQRTVVQVSAKARDFSFSLKGPDWLCNPPSVSPGVKRSGGTPTYPS